MKCLTEGGKVFQEGEASSLERKQLLLRRRRRTTMVPRQGGQAKGVFCQEQGGRGSGGF